MPVNLANAAATYAKIGQGQSPGQSLGQTLGAGPTRSGPDFASLVQGAAENAIDTLRRGEQGSLQAAAGKADLNEVVMAVSKADMTLQTVVAVRDRVIQAYQDILRMPI